MQSPNAPAAETAPASGATSQTSAALTSLDGQPYSYPAPLYVQKTFVQCVTRSTSFDDFYQERQIRSCPAGCSPNAAMKACAPDERTVPPSSLTTIESQCSISSNASSLGECSPRSCDEHISANSGQMQITTGQPMQFAAPGGGYVTLNPAATQPMQTGGPTSSQTFAQQESCQQHHQEMMQGPAGQFMVGYDHCLGTSQAGACGQMDYSMDYSPHQQQAYYHDQQHNGIDNCMNMHFNNQMHMSQPGQSGMLEVGNISRNPADQMQHTGQMFTHSAFNEYRVQPMSSPSTFPQEAAYSQEEYACGPPCPLPSAYECRPGRDMVYAQMGQAGGGPHEPMMGHAMTSPQTGLTYQQNTFSDFQGQEFLRHPESSAPFALSQNQLLPSGSDSSGQQMDPMGLPTFVLQLSSALSEQQQQQQWQHQQEQQQRQQQQQHQHFDAAPLLPPPAPPPLTPPSSIAGQVFNNRGSVAHEEGRCKPCAFMYTKGCENGAACQFCHLCEPGEKKKRRKDKLENRRTMRQLRHTLTGGLSLWWEGVRGGRENNHSELHE